MKFWLLSGGKYAGWLSRDVARVTIKMWQSVTHGGRVTDQPSEPLWLLTVARVTQKTSLLTPPHPTHHGSRTIKSFRPGTWLTALTHVKYQFIPNCCSKLWIKRKYLGNYYNNNTHNTQLLLSILRLTHCRHREVSHLINMYETDIDCHVRSEYSQCHDADILIQWFLFVSTVICRL